MPFDLVNLYTQLPLFALVASRLAGLILFQPILTSLAVPPNLRVLLVLGLAAMTTPFVSLPAPAPDSPLAFLVAMGGELLLGAALGLASLVCFVGLQMGGLLIAQESGSAFGAIADPSTNEEMSELSVFYAQMGAVVFLITGGHRVVLSICLDSLTALPLLADVNSLQRGAEVALNAATVGLELAVRVAAPTVLTLFLVNIAMGFISKALPQLNVLSVGFSMKSLIGFALIAASLPSAMTAFTEGLETTLDWAAEAIGK
ncbi:flagellar biosynthesis protein FliR [Phycisphaerae bacterium RAS1]|nr:flagellar biosynthesis protein FliR [Phycisphaerae bacterium RAS1]